MSGQNLDACFMRLIQNLRQNAKKKKAAVTLIIGAGCSLTSSQKDITTYGIIESLVRQHSIDGNIPSSWTELYKSFVNNVWEGQGECDRIQILEDFFAGMKPSAGYQAMRWLVENGYINNILTTNFDLMIDTVLEGLSYRLVVGSHEEIIGTDPKPALTLLKVHGDLRFGELRFAPDELACLPEMLAKEVQTLTSSTVLVVGYKGQDIGLLNALNSSGDHNAYWAAPSQPDQLNSYETKPVYTWMGKRNSRNNFLFGDDYGYFDKLLTKMMETLTALSQKDQLHQTSSFDRLWEKSPLFDCLRLNKRFLALFERLHCYLEAEVQEDLWRVTDPYCAQHYDILLRSILNLMQENTISPQYMYCVGNEVDALVFTLSCSVWVICQGYPRTAWELIQNIRRRFEAESREMSIGNEFWEAVRLLSGTGLGDPGDYARIDEPLSFYFDKEENLQTILMHIDIQGMRHLLSNILALLLFVPTCGNGGELLIAQKNKQALEKYLYDMHCYDSIIRLQMSKVPLSAYKEIYPILQQRGFSQTIIGDEYILSRDIIRVSFPVEKKLPDQKSSIWEMLIQRAQENRVQFFLGFTAEQFVRRQNINILSDFLRSPSNGLLMIGDSGSGKTVTLKLWLAELDPSEYLVYPVSGRDKTGIEVKNELENADKQIHYVEIMLEQRDQFLLIVFDAINEMRGTFADIVEFYKELLNFCDKLSREECARIKLVISCRNDFYYQLKKCSDVEPSGRSFYTMDALAEPQSLFQLPLLSEEEIGEFIDLYRLPRKNVTAEELRQEFGELIHLPINLNIICNAYEADNVSNRTAIRANIYDKWFRRLTTSAMKDAIGEETLWAVVLQTIHYLFFEGPESEAQTHRLSTDLSGQYPGILAAFEWLVLHRVFFKSESNPNLIHFSHDRLEEYFLSQYILRQYKDRLVFIDQILVGKSLEWPVVKHGMCTVLLTLFQEDRLTFITSLVTIIRNNNDLLLSFWINALLQITRDTPEETGIFMGDLEQYLLKGQFSGFLRAVLLQMHQMLEDMTDVGLTVVDTIAAIVSQSNAYEDPTLKVLSSYLRAKQRFLFPGENDTQAFRDSLELCRQVEQWLPDGIPAGLQDSHQMLEALLLQNQGQLNEAIDLMEQCYQRQTEYAMYDLACQSALYLGAMYREMTRFDDAISLYDSVETSRVTSSLLRYRLLMNKGIIYKNKIQNALFSSQGATKQNLQYYQSALDSFEQTCAYADQSGDIKLQLEIYAERVELGCVAYYLDLGTIKEAVSWVERMDKLLPRYHVPVERIQRHRMWARVLVLERKFEQAIEHLERGFEIAVNYNIPFRAADCCGQITGIICDTLNAEPFCTEEMLNKGAYYVGYAIDYYKQLNKSNHRYLQDSLEKYQRIEEARRVLTSKA